MDASVEEIAAALKVDVDWLRGFLARAREQAAKSEGQPYQPDDLDKIRAWAASLRETEA